MKLKCFYDIDKHPIAGKRRKTTIQAIDGEKVLAEGVAVCHSNDNDCKAAGRKVAMRKLMKSSDWSKEQRAAIWNQFFSKFPKSKSNF